MKNKAKEVMSQIERLEGEKAAEVKGIEAELLKARDEMDAANDAAKAASEALDVNAYESAQRAYDSAKIKKRMYTTRKEQIMMHDYVTEEESDKVIDSLLEYQDNLSADYAEAIKPHIDALTTLNREYRGAIAEAESVIVTWCSRIHSNHRSATAIFADGTNRSETPVPVHRVRFEGIPVSGIIDSFLRKVGDSYDR